jgi:chemotaxis protein CheY-P-specific phosphatase CheC
VTDRAPISPLMLTPPQVEALRQLAGLASADAARSLGRLLGTSVDADVPRAQVAPRGAVARVLQPEGRSFAVHFTVEGGARLRWLLHFTEQGATLMGGLLLGQPVLEPLGSGVPMYTSALAEAANIVVSSYVGGVGAAVGITLVPSIPHVEVGPLEGALEACFGGLDSVLLLVTDLRLPGVRSAGRIIAAPEEDSLSRLLKLLGTA